MDNQIEFAHVNLISEDWKKLARFYIEVFNCEPVYPERNMKGEWIDDLTNIKNAKIRGIHLRLPGSSEGPTLEIFEYEQKTGRDKMPEINIPGFAHIAFHADNVEEILNKLIENGGEKYGELVTTIIDGVGKLKVIYTRDPEGNIIEIQNWSK